ncbi:disease resistance protein RUN1-like isoform X4 [Diospyros lotus]|uniref:disease resistance protein RUN1-like isoform X4 n=1 Tax=Diospyros lotus TaxID=55363 RepID=UPI002254C244|nr:disease resistance protein RUN1-like isoform X4 [Diospyros lotus]
MASTRTQLQDAAFLPSGSSSWKYDVFLSFRGSDTRHGFVEHLYSALREMVIFPYQDDPKLEKGESISTALLKAIEESRLAVVIFSENYASSKWCLEELVKILDCQKTRGLTVLPVFYKVNPSDLQKQRGSVGEAFARHERDSSEEEEKQKVRRWRNALMEAASISGWDSNTHGPEAKLVHDIVIHILSILGYNGSSILEDVVGLYPRVAKVISLLEMGLELDDPRIVGIWGMGGIGKTTIAKAVYHQIRSQFHASCYLPNVREAAGVHGLESLQKSLFKDLSVSDNDIKIRNIDEPRTIMNRVRCKRVLVVLDDVDHSDQLDALVGRLDRFDPGSRIIITTRDRHLLARYGKSSSVYSVEGLNDEEAFKLFCCKAFRNNQPTPGFEHLIKRAVDYAKGVPLALKVLGCFLIGRKVNEWQSAIHRLGQEPNPDIQKALILSYEGLAHEEQEIFLDIACFFKRYSEYYTVVNILDACGFHTDIGIRILEDKALVTIRDNKIDVHDLIQEMGRHIVYKESSKEPGRRSRLWKYEDIYDTLTKKTGTKAVETIVFDSHETKEVFLSPDTFSKMSRLRLLKLSNVQLPDGLDYLSNDLRLLDWHEYPLKYLPSNFQPHSLVKLKMSSSCLERPWNGTMGFNDFPEFTIIVPGREIPKCFRYQNNMGHHVRIQLLPDWYQRLRGFVVCAVFEAKAPPIDAQVHVECYGMRNDDVIYATDILIGSFQFQSDHLLFDCMALGEGSWKVGGYDLKTWTEIIFYFSSYSPEMFVPDKCAVHIVYENDKEWPDPHASVQQWMQGIVLKKGSRHIFDYKIEIGEQSNPKRLRDTADSQSELSEISFQSIGDSAAELSEISIPIIGDSGAELPEISVHSIRDSAAELDIIHRVSRGKFEPGRNSFWPRWTDGRIEAVGFDHPCFGGGIWFSVAKSP